MTFAVVRPRHPILPFPSVGADAPGGPFSFPANRHYISLYPFRTRSDPGNRGGGCRPCFPAGRGGTSRAPPPTSKNVGLRIQGQLLLPLRECLSLAVIFQISTTTGRIKGGEKSPPLSFQGRGPGEGKSKSPPLACFLFLSTFSLHGQRENGRHAGGLNDKTSSTASGPPSPRAGKV